MINIITSVFVFVDDFLKIYKKSEIKKMIKCNRKRARDCKITLAEMITIIICFHFSDFKTFKHYYIYYIGKQYRHLFPNLISYDRFITVMPKLLVPTIIMSHIIKGQKTGIYFIDSTKLEVCHKKRTSSHKVFKGLAQIGKSSYGWFLGFKLHMVINNIGQIVSLKITKGNVDDRTPVHDLTKGLVGNIYGDKGYIKHNLFLDLYKRGLKFIYGIRGNMKNFLMLITDKIFLRKRSLIESSFNVLKNRMNLEHTRHRSPINFLVNTVSCLVAYQLKTTGYHLNKIKGKNVEMIAA